MDKLTITRPDDLHLHLRDGAGLASALADSARQFARAIIMPNLAPPVVSVAQACAYRKRILAALPPELNFLPLMTLYLTDNTAPDEVQRVANCEHTYAFKYYPAGATTHSEQGVSAIEKLYPVLEKMAALDVPLLLHGEVTDTQVDIFDREEVFIEKILTPLIERFPGLRVVLEHITTEQAAAFVGQGPATLAATITPQHLMLNRNALFVGGLRPHNYCLPVLKRERHRQALIAAVRSGSPKFFLGTDSAPHEKVAKENACGCAGVYSAHSALAHYAQIFAQAGCLERLEPFASFHGADFYGLPRNTDKVSLLREDWSVPASLPFAGGSIIPFQAGEVCQWKIADDE